MRWDALPAGHVVGDRYVVERLLGRGRTSAVYRSLDRHTGTRVALKVLDPLLARDPVALERFAREVEILRALDHPHVVRLYDCLRDGDLHVLCMEEVDGLDAKAWVARRGPLVPRELVPIARAMAAAVDACHRAGVLHRDLKPQNVLLTPRREVKLIDFGVSRASTMPDLTKTGTVLGTPEYMAPELFGSPTLDLRSDVYGIGAVLYELLTGRPPYVGGSLPEVMARHLRGDLEPVATFRADVPAWLAALVAKCLRVDPAERYQSAGELLRDLDRGERGEALREARTTRARCLGCRTDLLAGLPFCHRCGRFLHHVFEAGPFSVVLYACDEGERLAAELLRLGEGPDPAVLRRMLRRLPAVLLRGVSEETATAVMHVLAPSACEVRVAKSLEWELRLPRVYPFLAGLALAALVPAGSVPARLGMTLAAEAILVALYLRQVRPLLRLRALAGSGAPDPALLRTATLIRGIADPGLRALLGGIVASSLRLRALAPRVATAVRPERLGGVVSDALEAARRLEGYAEFLGGTSQSLIAGRLDAAERRLREARPASEVGALVEAKGRLARELADYRAIQDAHFRAHATLLRLHALLRHLDDAVRGEAALDGVAAELDEVEATLGETEVQPAVA
jgi:predicted Ser/Thr protein kinase